MKITFDPEADALYIQLSPAKVSSTKEVADGVYLDFDEKGELRGLEILYAGRRAPELAQGHVDLRWPSRAGSG